MRKGLKFLGISVIAIIIVIVFSGKYQNVERLLDIFHHDEYTSKYIYLLDRETMEAEYTKGEHIKTSPASLVKIMTTIVALENVDNLSSVAPVDIDTYRVMVESNASMAGFYGHEPVTYRDLLYGTILPSGGEAANSLAVNIAGSVDEFVRMMNDKAEEIGLKDTHFTNPEGLHHKDQYTTAHDMAMLMDYALDNGDFRAIITKESFHTTATADHPDGMILYSTVLSHLNDDPGNEFDIIGGKSGTTYEAGQCWATIAVKNGNEYIGIVMGAPLGNISNPDGVQIKDTIHLYSQIGE